MKKRLTRRTMTQCCSVAYAVVVQTLFSQLDMRPTPSSSCCWLMMFFCLHRLAFRCHLLFRFAMMPLLSSLRTFFPRTTTTKNSPHSPTSAMILEFVASTTGCEGHSRGSPLRPHRWHEARALDLRLNGDDVETWTFVFDCPFPYFIFFRALSQLDLSQTSKAQFHLFSSFRSFRLNYNSFTISFLVNGNLRWFQGDENVALYPFRRRRSSGGGERKVEVA